MLHPPGTMHHPQTMHCHRDHAPHWDHAPPQDHAPPWHHAPPWDHAHPRDHAPPPPPHCGQTHACKHITLPQTSFAGGNNSRKRGNCSINGVKRCGSRDLLVMNDSSAGESMADLVQSMEGAEQVTTMVGQLYQFLYREVFTVYMLLNVR